MTATASNPPLATPLTFAGAIRLDNALGHGAGAAGLAPTSTDPNFQPRRMQTWNVNVERELGGDGRDGRLLRLVGRSPAHSANINQFVNGVRPYPALSATSPILPGATLGNITEVDSARLVALQGPLDHREPAHVARGCSSARRTRCRSRPTPTRYDAHGDRSSRTASTSPDSEGPSDFDARHRFVPQRASTSCRSTATA